MLFYFHVSIEDKCIVSNFYHMEKNIDKRCFVSECLVGVCVVCFCLVVGMGACIHACVCMWGWRLKVDVECLHQSFCTDLRQGIC